MDLLIILTYAAICVAIFKIFKIPLNKWTVPTAVLGGIVIIGTLIFAMNYNHPYSEMTRLYFVTTPIVPTVSGKVVNVPVEGIDSLKQGDLMFQLDKTPYQNRLNQLNAQLVSAENDLARARDLLQRGAGNQRNVDLATASVDGLNAQIANAEYELSQTDVRAPTDGYVTQVTLRPGMMAVNLPLRPVMIFVHDEEHYLISWFRQNYTMRLQPGSEAEVAFDGIPGKVFSGKIAKIAPGLAEGQVQPTPNLITQGSGIPGRIPVWIKITDPEFEQYRKQLPGGAYAQAAVYSEHLQHVAVMRKILLRMSSWMNYLFPFH